MTGSLSTEDATPSSEALDQLADRELFSDLKRVLRSGALVLDVGAHHGEFARQLRQRCDVEVHSFEPVQESFETLVQNTRADPMIRPQRMAITDDPSARSVEFHVQRGDAGSSLLMPLPGQSSQWATYERSVVAPCTTVASYLDALGGSVVGLLKSDAQGADLRVLRSCGDILVPESIEAVCIEANFHPFYEGQDGFGAVVDYLNARGYFLAGFYRHYNRLGFLWWADVLFLPRAPRYAT